MKRYWSKRFSSKAVIAICAVLLISFSSISFGINIHAANDFSPKTNLNGLSQQVLDSDDNDTIQLKTIIVPEPATVLILGLGCLFVIRKNRR